MANNGTDNSFTFETVPGRVYELRLLLQRENPGRMGRDLSKGQVELAFFSAQGTPLDAELICDQPQVPDLAPAVFEVLPPCELTDEIAAAGLASRFLVAPPDARSLRVSVQTRNVLCRRAELLPLSVAWPTAAKQRFKSMTREVCQKRRELLERHLELSEKSKPVLEMMALTPLAQIDAIGERFAPGGNWQPAINALSEPDERQDFEIRMQHLRDQAERLPRVGFIGSERGHERLCGMAELFWLREAEHADQLALLDLDLVIIETTPGSGAGAEDADWHLAFSSLDGDLPEKGAAFLAEAARHKTPVHLWVTTEPAAAKLWRGCAAAVKRVIAEGMDEDWSDLGCKYHAVPRATEPAACCPAGVNPRAPDLMLIPAASDIFQFPEFGELVAKPGLFRPLLAEFRYRFVRRALDDRLGGRFLDCMSDQTRAQQRQLLRAASMVLLPARSLRSQAELEQMALDAIASGAIPVLFGTAAGASGLLAELDRIYSNADLIQLQALYRIHWVRERRWRKLLRHVMRHHLWRSTHRRALLGRDPFPRDFDKPLISAILVTKRPYLIKKSIETFRRQSWRNKELIMVLNMNEMPDDLPRLRKNEHVFLLSEAVNIGECLNRGINKAAGRYWAKMDDDDFYSATYLEETVFYFRASQAGIVGRQSAYFYFAGHGDSKYRPNVFGRCFTIRTSGFVSGATLSADRRLLNTGFSYKDRNSADSNWLVRLRADGVRIFSADATSMIVFRDSDESRHTWKVQANSPQFAKLASANLFDLLEN